MKQTGRKLLSILLAMLLAVGLFSAVTLTAYAAEGDLSGTLGTNRYGTPAPFTFSSSTGILEIGDPSANTVITEELNWPSELDKTAVKKVVFVGNVLIGGFSNNTWSTASLSFSNNFSGFSAMEAIEGLEKLDTSRVGRMSQMFNGCSELKSIDISSFNLSQVDDLTQMFARCEKLESIKLPNVTEGNKLRNIDQMFASCKSLTTVKFGEHFAFDNPTSGNCNSMFSGCKSLESIDLPDDFKGGQQMYSMFGNCSKLVHVGLPQDFGRNAEYINGMFGYCTSLPDEEVARILPLFNTDRLLSMAGLFNYCTKLTKVTFPESFHTEKVTNFSSLFTFCSNLKELDASHFDMSSATNTKEILFYCGKLEKAVLPENFFAGEYANRGYFPKYTKVAPYTGMWINEDDPNAEPIWYEDRNAVENLPAGTYVWEKEKSTITFYGDMAGERTIGEEQKFNIGESLSKVTLPDDPSKSGYYFAGWSTTKAEDTEIGYDYKQAMPNEDAYILADFENGTVTGNMEFYPVFIKDRLNVILVPGGDEDTPVTMGTGSDGKTQETNFTVNIDEPIRMTGLISTTRVGYELEGWYTAKGVKWNPEGTSDPSTWWPMTPEYADSSTPVKHPDRPYNYYTVTLTARWTPKAVTVEYDLGDHPAAGATVPTDDSTALGTTLTLPAAPEAEKDYKFIGWKIGDTLHSAGEVFTLDDWSLVTDGEEPKLTVVAQYIEDPDLSIEFNTNGGTAIEPIVAKADETITPPADPTKTGYEFKAWCSDEALQNEVQLPTTMPATSTTYYAKWTVKRYTITFNMNDATSDQIKPITQEYDTDVTSPEDPIRDHYQFMGWDPELPEKMPANDLTVNAIWEPNKYSVTFKADADDDGTTITDKYGTLVTPPDAPTKDNLTFVEWSEPNPIYMPDNNPTITAKWKPNPTPSDETAPDKKDGKISGLTDEMEYSTDGGETWIPVPEGATEVTNLAPGEYQVRFAEEGPYKSDQIVTVTIQPGAEQGGGNNGGNDGGNTGTKYPVNVTESTNGTVTPDKDKAAPNSKVTLTVTPDEGYEADKVTVTDKDGKVIPVTKNDDGTYSFQMPKSPVNVSVTYKEAKKAPASPEQTGVADWLITDEHPAFFSGYEDGSIRPEGNITRAEVAMIFYRLLKNQDVEITVSFPDVNDGDWYAAAVNTLASLKIITGYEDGTFAPDKQISRAEFSAIATRFAKATGGKQTFADVEAGYWAEDNIATAYDYGWIEGKGHNMFAPLDKITRAEAAAIINRMLNRAADEAYVSANGDKLIQFPDLQDSSKWYYLDMVEATNEHDFTVDNGVETWK